MALRNLILICWLVPLLGAAERVERFATFERGLAGSLAALEAKLQQPKPEPDVRDLAAGALTAMVLHRDVDTAQGLLRRAFATQNLDPSSPDYGDFPWRLGHPEIHDRNAVEFTSQPLGPLYLHYGAAFPEAFRQEMRTHIKAALAAISRHQVKVGYTNIYLMQAVNLIVLGEAVADAEAAASGYRKLDEWIQYTRQSGIREFDSPGYYLVDIIDLLIGEHYARLDNAREKFRHILGLFWSDIAANFFIGRGSLSGPHARDYDFLNGHGDIEYAFYLEGLRAEPPPKPAALGRAYLLENERVHGYHPNSDILDLASLPERVVRSIWENKPGHNRYNYVTPEYAIGSSSADYNTYSKPISVELGHDPRLPAVTILPQSTGGPYGTAAVPDNSGQTKPYHPLLYPVSVQEKGVLLVTLDPDPREAQVPGPLTTNIILPARVDEIVLNGLPITVGNTAERRVSRHSILGLRDGHVGLCVRLLLPAGDEVALETDGEGLRRGVMRFAIRAGKQSTRFALLFQIESCPTEQHFRDLLRRAGQVRYRETITNGEWRAGITVDALQMEVTRRLADRVVLSRRINGREAQANFLSVNDRDLMGKYLNGLP